MLVSTLSPTSSVARRGRDVAPGTCGELAQGVLPDGTPFVVTCPIDRGTTIEVTLSDAAAFEIVGVPSGRTRLHQALLRTAELVELEPCRISISHDTALPIGKGMASSTADIVAASRALAAAAGVALSPEEVATLAVAIEPSDAVMYAGIVAADRRTGVPIRAWDWWPSFTVVAVIPPTTFATADACLAGQARFADDYASLLGRLDEAVARRDEGAFARVATRSAELGQPAVANPTFGLLAGQSERLGALGVCAAHTGTVAGLLFPRTRAGEADAAGACDALATALPADHELVVVHTPRVDA